MSWFSEVVTCFSTELLSVNFVDEITALVHQNVVNAMQMQLQTKKKQRQREIELKLPRNWRLFKKFARFCLYLRTNKTAAPKRGQSIQQQCWDVVLCTCKQRSNVPSSRNSNCTRGNGRVDGALPPSARCAPPKTRVSAPFLAFMASNVGF